ncbi:MAG: alpha-galactosidase [Oscillospiraceae bacterium]|nr:alpha-galactosidase [Oscillospiraceae bacterium]
MKKIAFIGAGSFGFTRTLVKDILSFPALADCEIALMDIDAERLEAIEKACRKIAAAGNRPAVITATTDRAAALDGADGVVITILSGAVRVWRHDIEIPKRYGVDINVGDTRGPSGIFRFLRTAPVMLEICADIAKYCPRAIVLNYTNPMAMLCRVMQAEYPRLTVTGLCHSVQGTAHMLASWIGADFSQEVTYLCAGINHQAWYLDYRVNGEDAYPQIRAAVEKEERYNEEIVRNEMFLHLGYYVTESSGHNSEYNPWFRKRSDLIEKYCTHGTGWNPGRHRFILDEYLEREHTWPNEIQKYLDSDTVDIERGGEYAAYIFDACFGSGTLFEFNGNVRNYGLIDNLPAGACVEVPVVASRAGLRAAHVGALPPQLAILNNLSAGIEELAVEGFFQRDRTKVFQAILCDPLTSAVCSMREIKDMVEEMFAQNRDFLSDYR